ncbi:2612_t:CDS:2, partial [Dentiscutata heterogama]
LFGSQKEWHIPFGHRLKISQPLYPVSAFQNGKYRSSKITTSTQQLYDIHRYQECILKYSNSKLLGFTINNEKSSLVPTNALEYLGFHIDSKNMTISLPRYKIKDTIRECQSILKKQEIHIRKLASIIGKLISTTNAVFPARLRSRALLRDKNITLKKYEWDSMLTLSTESRAQITWWINELQKWNGIAILQQLPEITIYTDASHTGWGTVLENCLISGKWSPIEQNLHINALEALAVFKALKRLKDPQKNQQNNRINMGLRLRKINKNTCSSHTRQKQHTGRLGVKAPLRQTRLGNSPLSIRSNNIQTWASTNRPICKFRQFKTPKVFFLEKRTRHRTDRRIHNVMDRNIRLHQPSVGPNAQGASEDFTGQSENDISVPLLEICAMVPNSGEDHQIETNTDSELGNPSRSTVTHTSNSQPQMESLHSTCLRESLQEQGYSEQVFELASKALDPIASSTVSSNIRIWQNWCKEKSLNPISCGINEITSFLHYQLSIGKAYNTIAGYRTAISEIHQKIDGTKIGSHPIIVRIMKGIWASNPPLPPLDDVSDIVPSLDTIIKWGNNENLPLLQLNKKTAFLLAITTGSRPSDLCRLDMTSISRSRGGINIKCIMPKEAKISTAKGGNKRSKIVFIGKYDDEPLLCPLTTLNCLKERIDHLNIPTESKKHLFISSRIPHKPVSVDTISRWIKEILHLSNPDLTAKDTRALSAFFAQNAGVDLPTILALGNWSSNEVYQRFYQCGIRLMLERNNLPSTIINKARNL